jgi:gluconate 2-dehydrogenase gamma chain
MFFTDYEARMLDAVTARIIPSEPDGLGAREAAVVTYIDGAVAGYFRDLQALYRQGLQQLDDYCRSSCGAAFADLPNDVQDHVLAAIDATSSSRSPPDEPAERLTPAIEETILSRFFAIVVDQTIQGMFCDPMYGGNRGFVGWKLIGFPGAQWGYTAEQMQPGFDATTISIQSLSDLRQVQVKNKNG